jgi:hypothetical protein
MGEHIEVHDAEELVTKSFCAQRGKINSWLLGILFSIMALFLGIVTFSAARASAAVGNTNAIRIEVKEHIAQDTEQNKSVIRQLEDIKTELREQRVEQKRLLEKIIEISS